MTDYKKLYEGALERAKYWAEGKCMEGFYNSPQNVLDFVFPKAKEGEDEKIRKEIIDYLKDFIPHHEYDLVAKSRIWIAWLEKQGRQKPAIYHKFRVGDEIITQNEESLTITKIDDEGYWSGDLFICNFDEEDIWDLAEPRFKVGDWVVWDNMTTYHIEDIYQGKESLMYTVTDTHNRNRTHSFSVKGFERYARLWTIQDAKDGDVLVASDGSIFLFKDVIDCGCKHYVGLTTNNEVQFNEGLEHYWETSTAVHPAAKEQRDLLFQKMNEAGYEWDAEKKELKKIGQKHTYTPRFKVGDWAVWDNKISCYIESIYQGKESLMYTYTDTYIRTSSHSVKDFDNYAHLWTIEDAKDGDVLREDSCTFIIERMKPDGTATIHYCLFDDGGFDLGSNLSFDVYSTHPATKEQRDLLFSKMKEAGYEWDAEKKELKKIEQKPAYTPKFKVGDWITDNTSTFQIVRVENEWYYADDGDKICFDVAHQYYHLWTIEDAKDGDVLAVEAIEEKYQYPFVVIYKEHGLDFFNSYCFIGFDGKFDKAESGHSTEKIHPATKEQRDLLFTKMKEAGYEWDVEKKELKVSPFCDKTREIKSSSDWDERIREGLIYHLKELRDWDDGEYAPIKSSDHYDAWLDWLENHGEQKPIEWSDEDEKMFRSSRCYLNEYGNWLSGKNKEKSLSVYKACDWLLSLFDIHHYKIETLYDDLKKLKGE